MNWSRVKTILIVLFLFINIFLLVNMMVSVNKTITISLDAVKDTVEVLKANGVKVDPDIIPVKMHNMPSIQMENPMQNPLQLAESILGSGFTQKNIEDEYEFTREDKILKVRGSEFIYRDGQPGESLLEITPEKAESTSKNILEGFGIDLKYAKIQSIDKIEEGKFKVFFAQQYSKKDIFSNYIIVTVSNKGVSEIRGYWLTPNRFTAEKLPMRHVTGILINFIKNPDRPQDKTVTVTDIALGYYGMDTNSTYVKDTMATPTWRITTDDGRVYYYDAATANYIKND